MGNAIAYAELKEITALQWITPHASYHFKVAIAIHLDQSGLITFTGQILLGKALGFTQPLDDRKSPSSFCRGKSVTLDIADTNNSLTRHPRGTLRLLTPKYDNEK